MFLTNGKTCHLSIHNIFNNNSNPNAFGMLIIKNINQNAKLLPITAALPQRSSFYLSRFNCYVYKQQLEYFPKDQIGTLRRIDALLDAEVHKSMRTYWAL